MCNDLVMAHHPYSLYRGVSGLTHPTAAVGDYYLQPMNGSNIPALRPSPRLEDDFMRAWLHIACSALVWSAARIVNLKDAQRAKEPGERNRLRIAADRLGIPPFLEAKTDATHRGKKSERQRAAAITRETKPTP